MDNATPVPRCCEVCGRPLRSDNKSGICGTRRGGSECARVRARRKHAERPQKSRREPDEGRRHCDVCGRPLNRDNVMGVCSSRTNATAACEKEYQRRRYWGLSTSREPSVVAGAVFGRWTALETCAFGEDSVLCRCDCGRERRVRARELIVGASRDCGCGWRVRAVKTRLPDPYMRAGTVFGRLTLLEDVPHSNYRALCRCECEAGTETRVLARTLNAGRSRSCGCLSRERVRTHGLSRHPLYGTWCGMIDRCTNPDSHNWDSYGGRGITVCERWHNLRLFVEDIESDLGPRPKGMTLDRTDNELGYQPGNVRWADGKTQRTNQRTVTQLTRERDEARRERDVLAAEVDRLTALLASRNRKATVPESDITLF